MFINHPSKLCSFAITLGTVLTFLELLASFLLLPFSDTLPPTLPPFQLVVRKFEKSHFIMKRKLMFACFSPLIVLSAMSKTHFSQASVSSKHLPGKKKSKLEKNYSVPLSYRSKYIIYIFSSICVYKYISKYIHRYIYVYFN